MSGSEQISRFVHQALAQGAERSEIGGALADAGWSDPEIAQAMDAWKSQPGLPPIPRPQRYVSGFEVLIYGLLFVTLAQLAWHMTALGVEVIARFIPDPNTTYTPSGGPPRWSIASLIAFVPLFLWLNVRVDKLMASDDGRDRSIVRKWFSVTTMLICLLVLLVSAIYVIYGLLSGDLTLQFFANTVLIAVIAALIITYVRGGLDGRS